MLRISFFKTASKMANNYKELNAFRRSIAAPFIGAGVGGGMYLGANAGLIYGITHPGLDHKNVSRSTTFGTSVGMFGGFGLAALTLFPEAAFMGSIGYLAYEDHQNQKENSSRSLRP